MSVHRTLATPPGLWASGDWLPPADDVQSLGSTGLRVKRIHVQEIHMVDDTDGNTYKAFFDNGVWVWELVP